MNIAFFGSSLVSAYWNGAATYYRGILRALYGKGHQITFYEPDAYDRQKNRDIEDPEWAQISVYAATEDGVQEALEDASDADLIVKASGVGLFDDFLEESVVDLKRPSNVIAFWDVDAPATLDRIAKDPKDPFRPIIPSFDIVFTYGGGVPVTSAYCGYGARACVPVYNGLDPSTHFPVEPDNRYASEVAFLGNRLPDREARVEEFFLRPAAAIPDKSFLLGGAGWDDKALPPNVRYVGHVYTVDHNALNSTAGAVVNVSRASMAQYGFSPATRIFEAAGAGACIITDAWDGIETFFEPEREILVAGSSAEMIELIQSLTVEKARRIGKAALQRALREHTYANRGELVAATLEGENLNTAGALS